MTTENVITVDRELKSGRLCRFGYRPACDEYLASVVINYGSRFFRHSRNRWQRIENGRMLCLNGEISAIAENMHVEYINA